jgi:hypothetical protein
VLSASVPHPMNKTPILNLPTNLLLWSSGPTLLQFTLHEEERPPLIFYPHHPTIAIERHPPSGPHPTPTRLQTWPTLTVDPQPRRGECPPVQEKAWFENYCIMTRPKVDPAKRQRIAQACDACKRRKQKVRASYVCLAWFYSARQLPRDIRFV